MKGVSFRVWEISTAPAGCLLAPPISKTRLIWLKQAIMFRDKGPNNRGGKRNFMDRHLYGKWHFCVLPWRMSTLKRPVVTNGTQLKSEILSHKWKFWLKLLEHFSGGVRHASHWRHGATWNVDFCIHMPPEVFAHKAVTSPVFDLVYMFHHNNSDSACSFEQKAKHNCTLWTLKNLLPR